MRTRYTAARFPASNMRIRLLPSSAILLVPLVAYVALSVRAEGMAKLSDLYVLNLRGTFIKIRATYPVAAANGEARADVRTFTGGIIAALDRSFAKP